MLKVFPVLQLLPGLTSEAGDRKARSATPEISNQGRFLGALIVELASAKLSHLIVLLRDRTAWALTDLGSLQDISNVTSDGQLASCPNAS